ncbi:hypothetical protein V2S66_12365 [Streptomyces sp. V4-01]|uniref:Uncharacterized protein n=1 Tax=Actinacidiphila polyblastidii TaxID=3110430 RepID=A0ABU7PAB3_9ACTN|nr:hypothetical protein [Streptomyces sp. V4-01]
MRTAILVAPEGVDEAPCVRPVGHLSLIPAAPAGAVLAEVGART